MNGLPTSARTIAVVAANVLGSPYYFGVGNIVNLFQLSIAAGLLSLLAWGFWRWEHTRRPRGPRSVEEAVACEPMDEL